MNGDSKRPCVFVFVILHYKTIDDTIRCVDSIKLLNKKKDDQVKIIIIDNHSNNGTGEQLEARYKNEEDIIIDLEPINHGFSKGNNLGYKRAKEFCPDYIVVCNSDIIFIQQGTLQVIKLLYDQSGFGVLGPDIYIPKKKIPCQSTSRKNDRRRRSSR